MNLPFDPNAFDIAEIERIFGSETESAHDKQMRIRRANFEREQAELAERMRKAEGKLFPDELPPPESSRIDRRVAFFIKNRRHPEAIGIAPALASAIISQFDRMFIAQAAFSDKTRLKSDGYERRHSGWPKPGLKLIAAPPGSFGLEFEPLDLDMPVSAECRGQDIKALTDSLYRMASSSDESFDEVVSQLPPHVLEVMKQFFGTLTRYDCEVRFSDWERVGPPILHAQIAAASARLENQIRTSEETFDGRFEGLKLNAGEFEFRTTSGELLEGGLTDGVSDETKEKYKHWFLEDTTVRATLTKLVTTAKNGKTRTSWTLERVEQIRSIEPTVALP